MNHGHGGTAAERIVLAGHCVTRSVNQPTIPRDSLIAHSQVLCNTTTKTELSRRDSETLYVSSTDYRTNISLDTWRQREYNFGGDAEGIKEQLQGIRKTVSLLDDNVAAIESVVSPCGLCKTSGTIGFNENS